MGAVAPASAAHSACGSQRVLNVTNLQAYFEAVEWPAAQAQNEWPIPA